MFLKIQGTVDYLFSAFTAAALSNSAPQNVHILHSQST
jgi:hypothetical protein